MASDLDWESVRYFLWAARSRSLSGAARALRVEHTTVGRRISNLERALGAPLVERGPAGLALTPLGRRVFELAGDMAGIASAIVELAAVDRTNVRLVVPTGFTALLTPHLETLRSEEPRVSLDIVSSGRRVDLREGEADLAIRVGPIEDESLIARKLGEVGSALYAARRYLARQGPVDLEDLSGHAIIGFHRSLAQTPAAEWLAARSRRATVVLRSREAMDMFAAAQSGAGLAVLPCFIADGDPSLVRLTPSPIGMRRVSVVYRREARLSPEVHSVIAFIVGVVRQHASRLRGVAS
jgi:DNA-binding transcriptional LysR family regulator